MDTTAREAWLNALRSGNFKQTTGLLNRAVPAVPGYEDAPVGQCCLVVLCETQGVPKRLNGFGNSWLYDFPTGECAGSPDAAFIENIGLTDTQVEELINMNDIDRKTFAEIADWIEENL